MKRKTVRDFFRQIDANPAPWILPLAWGMAIIYFIYRGEGVDGEIYLEAARRWLASGSPYALPDTCFRQPTLMAILSVPFAVLPEPVGLHLWGIAVGIMLAVGLMLIRWALPGRSRSEELWLLFTVGPIATLWLHQGASLVFLLMALGLWLASINARWFAGISWGIAISLKMQMFFIILPFVIMGNFVSVIGALVGILFGLLLGMDWQIYRTVLQIAQPELTPQMVLRGGSSLWHIRFFIVDLFPGSQMAEAPVVLAGISLVFILFCYVFFVWKGWKGQQWGYVIASVLGLSITPYPSHYDAVFFLPAALILARKKDIRLPMGLFWGFTLILGAWNAFVIPLSSWPTNWPSILPLLPLLIAAVTWIVCRHKTAENPGDVKC